MPLHRPAADDPVPQQMRPISVAEGRREAPRGLVALVAALALLRLTYHLIYMGESYFAAATFSDGRLYVAAARDILAHPPWGHEPFYLQGAYAYFMALGMSIYDAMAPILFLQLLLAAASLWLLHVTVRRTFGGTAAYAALALVLASPALAFYENKFLSAELGVACDVFWLAAAAAHALRPSPGRAAAVGLFGAGAILARGNMLLAVPGVAVAVALRAPARRQHLLAFTLGLLLGLAPMALRNLVVTGRPTVFPAHGGGTSLYIGNNPHSRGVWNTAGGLVTPEVTRERDDLARKLEIGVAEEARAQAVGQALRAKVWEYARDEPGAFARLQARKLWLLLGNDELTQDYDWHGEQEVVGPIFAVWARLGPPFGILLALGALGLIDLFRRGRVDPVARAWWWVLVSQVLAVAAANLVFFVSAQHRVPLVVPLGVAGGLLVARWLAGVRAPEGRGAGWLWGGAALLAAQAFVPRTHKDRPSAAHHYNLSVVASELGDRKGALAHMERALERRPDDPRFQLERARLLWKVGRLDEADHTLDALEARQDLPAHVRDQIPRLRRAVARERGDAPGDP